jgi:hypothetical protein
VLGEFAALFSRHFSHFQLRIRFISRTMESRSATASEDPNSPGRRFKEFSSSTTILRSCSSRPAFSLFHSARFPHGKNEIPSLLTFGRALGCNSVPGLTAGFGVGSFRQPAAA